MDTRPPTDIADEWIAKGSYSRRSKASPDEATSSLDNGLAREQPELCLASIVEVLRKIETSEPGELMATLAAGPLEDLLNENGDAVLDEVDRLARQDPAFRLLLNGVWDSCIKPDILEKLARYRTRPW